VKDVALHLFGVDVGNLSLRRDGFSDPWWDGARDDLVSSLNQWNETWVAVARRLSPRLLCELLRVTGEEVASYFFSLDPAAIGGPVSWAGPDPAPVWLDIAREYTERWVHQQQIRDALGRQGLAEPRYLAPVLATFVHALPYTLREQGIGGCWARMKALQPLPQLTSTRTPPGASGRGGSRRRKQYIASRPRGIARWG
jgi:hypothetical protein